MGVIKMSISIDGRKLAEKYKQEIIQYVQGRKEKKLRVPCLAAVIVGNDGGSIYYMKNQERLCNELGMKYKTLALKEDIKEEQLIDLLKELNEDKSVDGIIIMMPLPKHINEKAITSAISYKKDIDGLTDINTGRFYKGEKCFVPCTPRSVLEIIKSTGISIEGKNAVVVGRSNIVGKPAFQLLLRENATVTMCHSKTKNIQEVCRNADILVSAMGKPGFITGDFIKEGAVVIDVGTSMVSGKIRGDVDFKQAESIASFITPVPGGVGSLTTTMLLKNACEALEENEY